MHKNFYENLKNKIKNEFYEKNEGHLIVFKYNKFVVSGKEEYKVNYKKNRDKYTIIKYDVIEDKETTQRALEANNMHYLDSKLVLKILEKYEIISIHDCFGIRLFELHKVMDFINKYYSKYVGFDTYCIHILK
jgi:hypothetical protein